MRTSEPSIIGLSHTTADGGVLRVRALSDHVIQVSYRPPGRGGRTSPGSLIVPQAPPQAAPNARLEGDSLVTPALRVRLDAGTGRLRFSTADGTCLLEEGARDLTPAPIADWDLYRTRQVWTGAAEAAFYGLGQHEQSVMDYQGKRVLLRQVNKDAVTPFVLSSAGYGILWDANSICAFESDGHGGLAFEAEAAFALDYYFMYGPSYDQIIAGYRELTGAAPMFPRWAFGYLQSKERYKTQAEVLETAARFRELGFPLDLIIQDWRYWGDDAKLWSGMTWDPERFPDPDAMIRRLHDELQVKFMAVIWPIVGEGTELCRDLEAINGCYDGTCWPGTTRLYKAYNADARALYWRHAHRGLFQRGLDAWWMDGSEPEGLEALSGDSDCGPLEATRNAYSLVHTEGVYEGQRAVSSDKRVMILTRSAYAGQQRAAAAAWSGDITAGWDTFRKQVTAGINFCMSGLPYWTTDIGAFWLGRYRDNQEPAYRELYTRWFQFGAFCPLFRAHGTVTPREPWHFGDEYYPVLKRYADLRYRLLPYLYTLASEVTRKHGTLLRGLPMDFPEDPQVRTNGRQFLFGPSLMVCPVTEGVTGVDAIAIPPENLRLPDGTPGGLHAEYFRGRAFEESVRVTQDPQINFNWSIDPPAGLPHEDYSVRWRGWICPDESGRHDLETFSEDGIRVWIDGACVVDQWRVQGLTREVLSLDFEAGSRHELAVEYFQARNNASVQLLWTTPAMRRRPECIEAEVCLPACEGWFDFWTGEFLPGGQTRRRRAPLDLLPLHVRAGSILPMGPVMQYTGEKAADPIELRIYPGRDAEFTLYEDEGDGYGYEKGVFSLIPMTWDDAARTLTLGARSGTFPGMLRERTFQVIVVRPGVGSGDAPSAAADAVLRYNGSEIRHSFPADGEGL